MTRFLLDVNVLIALIDPRHLMHEKAHAWFGSSGAKAWATCPMTQNGVLRIVGQPGYAASPGNPAAVAGILRSFLRHPGHEFWSDATSLLDQTLVNDTRLLNAAQITDTYLLALAVHNGGKLATFDRKLVPTAVQNGAQALHLID